MRPLWCAKRIAGGVGRRSGFPTFTGMAATCFKDQRFGEEGRRSMSALWWLSDATDQVASASASVSILLFALAVTGIRGILGDIPLMSARALLAAQPTTLGLV